MIEGQIELQIVNFYVQKSQFSILNSVNLKMIEGQLDL